MTTQQEPNPKKGNIPGATEGVLFFTTRQSSIIYGITWLPFSAPPTIRTAKGLNVSFVMPMCVVMT